jgi:hypothetical protein
MHVVGGARDDDGSCSASAHHCRNVDLSHPPVHNSDECGNQVTLHGHCPRSPDDMKVAWERKAPVHRILG